ncbi:MAG: hypothetical protein WC603_00870 [Candidatus Paceibacterota bacterium]
MGTLEPLSRRTRLLWMYNTLIHPHRIKIIIVCFDSRDKALYPCHLSRDQDVEKKINNISIETPNVIIIEVIDLDKEPFDVFDMFELENFY